MEQLFLARLASTPIPTLVLLLMMSTGPWYPLRCQALLSRRKVVQWLGPYTFVSCPSHDTLCDERVHRVLAASLDCPTVGLPAVEFDATAF